MNSELYHDRNTFRDFINATKMKDLALKHKDLNISLSSDERFALRQFYTLSEKEKIYLIMYFAKSKINNIFSKDK